MKCVVGVNFIGRMERMFQPVMKQREKYQTNAAYFSLKKALCYPWSTTMMVTHQIRMR